MTTLPNILILLATLLTVFAVGAFNGLRQLLGAQVDLLPALMVYTALSSGPPMMISMAVVGGLSFDTLSANPLGTSVLPLLLVGFVIQLRRDLILRDQIYAQLILGLLASAVAPAISLLILLTFGQSPLLQVAVRPHVRQTKARDFARLGPDHMKVPFRKTACQ